MNYANEDAANVLKIVETCLKEEGTPRYRLQCLWQSLHHLHARGLTNGIRKIVGDKVIDGLFKGMVLSEEALITYRAPILLGIYEHELIPVFEKIIADPIYTRILNIGCSVGYYATGLALRMPQVQIYAYETDPEARAKCANMLKINGVEDRVRLGGHFSGADFPTFVDSKTLVLMDIEGAEKDLLDPKLYPALKKMDILVELHDVFDPTITPTIFARFEATHELSLIRNKNIMPDVSKLFHESQYIDAVEQALLGWEARDGATPWGFFKVKT